MTHPMNIREHFDLKAHNTMGVAAKARYYVSVESTQALKDLLADPSYEHLPKLMLGGGSNMLFVRDFDGLVIHMNIQGIEIISETEKEVQLKVGAGMNWHQLVLYCVNKGWGGIENLSLIPGSVGAAPIQNIGAYGVELDQVFVSLEAISMDTGELKEFTRSQCAFGYRDSIFKQELKGEYIITSVTLALQKQPVVNTTYRALADKLEEKGISDPTIQEVSEAVIEIRSTKLPDPNEIGNTGSFFKNPVISRDAFEQLQEKYPDIPSYPAGDEVKVPAAWLIDRCGWKGKQFGDAGVHKKQALVLVNYGTATGEEIWKLAQKIRSSVKDTFGIILSPEVNLVPSAEGA